MRDSWLIALNTVRELHSKKILYVLLLVVVFISLGVGSTVFFIFEQANITDPDALLSRKASVLSQVLNIWSAFTILFALIFSAGAVNSARKSKVIISLLAKPVKRWQYLLGRWGGILLFFYAFLVVGIVAVLILMMVWDLNVNGLFVTGIIYNLGQITVYSGLAFVLSLFVHPFAGGGTAFLLLNFDNQIESLMENSKVWISWIGYILYYLIPSFIKDNVIQAGLLENMLQPDYLLYWGVILENFLYAGVVFCIAAYFFKRMDIVK